MPRLSPVPDAPRRALGLIRVSKEREVMISPDVQRTAISDHAARRGYVIVDWVEGIDQSGSRAKSAWWPRLDQACQRVVDGDVDVILVWRFDRTARNRLRWAVALDRVDTAGGSIESTTEPIDTTTASGRLARGMLGEFAAYRAEEIGANWRDAHAHRTAQGLPANGKPRFGYAYVDGRHRPDPDTGSVLASMYRRYVGGESVYRLVEWLNSESYRTVPGYSKNGPGPWTQVTLRRTLDTGFGAGFITVGGERRRGVHEPVIDDDTWTAYLAARAARRTLRRSERSQYLLSGMMRCMHVLDDGRPCGSSMGGGQFGTNRQPKYRCLASAAERRHQGGYVTMRVAEDEVYAWLQRLAGQVGAQAEKVATRSPGRPVAKRDADAIAREIARLDEQLVTLTLQVSRGLVPERVYAATRDQIDAELARLAERHARAMLTADKVDAGPIAAQLLLDTAAGLLSVDEQRAVLRKLISRVEVVPGRPRSVVRVVPAWAIGTDCRNPGVRIAQ